MGRPLNKRYFGQGQTGHEIKVTAKVPGKSVGAGFIVRQRGTRKFLVEVGGKQAVCQLVDKAKNQLADGEMIITVLTDGNTLVNVTKLTNRAAIVNGQKVQWNFAASQEDAAVQVPEADEPDLEPVVPPEEPPAP